MKKSKFPSTEEALFLHELLISRFGGSPGVRDLGLLESALARPRSGYYETLCEQAAALLHSMAKNHCFVDGNKRMALALTATFLLMNGYELRVGADDSEGFIVEVSRSRDLAMLEISPWIEDRICEA